MIKDRACRYRDLASALPTMKVTPTSGPWFGFPAALSAFKPIPPTATCKIAAACRFIGKPFQKLLVCARVVLSRYRMRTSIHTVTYYMWGALASSGYPLKLVDKEKRDRSAQDIARLLRERLEKIPGITRVKVLAVDPAGAILAGRQSKPLVVEVQGSDLEANVAAAEGLAERMRRVPGLVDVSVSQKDPRPELWVEVERDKIGLAGLTAGEVGRQLRNYLYGFKAAEYRDGADNYDIFTRFTEEDKNRLELLPQAPIFTADGRTLRLKDLAEISERHGPIEIERKNLERVVRVEAGLLGLSLGQGRRAAQVVMDALDPAPGGTRLSFGGEVEEQRKAFADLTLLLALGILLTYRVMAALFGNFRDPFIVMFSAPFALVGVIYAFRLTGVTLGIISFMGVVMLWASW